MGKHKAYLQLIVYDKHEKYVRQERKAVTAGAGVCEELALSFTAEEDGFVQVLVANESSTDTWFDDLDITYTPGLIVQEQHYDPWGLTLAGIEKDGDYPFQFNSGSEKQKDASGHGYYYETDFRGYDPQLGRFRGVDILADEMPGISPYHFSYNNPVMFSDPRGDSPVLIGALVGAGVGGVVGGVISSSNGDGFWRGFAIGATIGAGVGAGAGALYQSNTAVGQWMRNFIDNTIRGTDPPYALAKGTGGGGGFAAAAQAGGELLASTGSDLVLTQTLNSNGVRGTNNQQQFPVFYVLEAQMSETYAHIRDAQAAGYPQLLTRDDPSLSGIKRYNALDKIGVPTLPGKVRDEYPFASTVEHRLNPSVRHVPRWEQNMQGWQLSEFYRTNNIKPASSNTPGGQFYVQPIPRGGLDPQHVPVGIPVPQQYLRPAPVLSNPQPSFLEKILKFIWPAVRHNTILHTQ